MTSIGSFEAGKLQTTSLPSQRLAAGQTIEARVLGVTRHGVSVSVGQETLQLSVPARLADASTLTLRGAAPPSGDQVQIIAKNNQPLAKPVVGTVVTQPAPQPSDASIIVAKGQVEVSARPVASDGKALGPRVSLYLQTSAATIDTPRTAELAGTAASNGSASGTVDHGRPRTSTERPTILPPFQANGAPSITAQPERSVVARPQSDPAPVKSPPAEVGPTPKNLPAATPSSQPAVPSSASAVLQSRLAFSGSIPQQTGPLKPTSAPAPTTPISAGEPISIAGKPVPAAAVDRQRIDMQAGNNIRTSPHNATPMGSPPMQKRSATMTATVIGQTNTGNVLLRAGDQLLKIEQPIDLPTGTTLMATYAQAAPSLPASIEPSASERVQTLLTKLIDLLNDIDRQSPQPDDADQPASTRQLPAPDKNLTSRFLHFLSAAGGGHIQGDAQPSSTQQGLTQSAQGDRLQSLIRELGGVASEPLSEGWRTLLLPLESDPTQAISFFYQDHWIDADDQQAEADAGDDKGKRAVFDVSFSQLGRCQIDVFCQHRRFDLMIRNETELAIEDREAIAGLFSAASEIAGLSGEIVFGVGDFFEPARSSTATTELRT